MNAAPSLVSVELRAGIPADHRRVYGDWLNSYASSAWAKTLTPREQWERGTAARAYWDGHHDLIERLLERAELVVAHWPEDVGAIVGWTLFDRTMRILHYVQVKQAFRRSGVARRLLAPLLDGRPVTYTHKSRGCGELPIPANWRFDPYLAFNPT